ncbi:MAG: PLP-dependent aminotransferase family protein [Anaerovoracaceae bacterium]|jgi:GntR family transcriptional regulator/MocR family aminotransferase
MKAIIPMLDENSAKPLYLQLYEYIKDQILTKAIVPGEKLPSLRNLSSSLDLSLTTVEGAYNQLAVEGYIESRPKAGYFVNDMFYPDSRAKSRPAPAVPENLSMEAPAFEYDLSCFDFNKWKKCTSRVITEHPQTLLFEGDTRGEISLRSEIAKYVYRSRGVICTADQIIIAAGTQQITSLLTAILGSIGLTLVAVEEPGYLPVRRVFRDHGFTLSPVPVEKDGIDIDHLPTNIRCTTYVNPSNQFPTGAVMSAGKRYRLLDWAEKNNSYIIEDDYDSELRYFGKPIPSLQSLDQGGRVIYLGSFSSTLFAAVKISYMVLPESLSLIFDRLSSDYSQTCSKTEQLALALFMSQGYYQTGIKKQRRLYSQKLQKVLKCLPQDGFITVGNANSGINMIISVKSPKPASKLCQEAADLGIYTAPVENYTDEPASRALIFYYNRIPMERIEEDLQKLNARWRV